MGIILDIQKREVQGGYVLKDYDDWELMLELGGEGGNISIFRFLNKAQKITVYAIEINEVFLSDEPILFETYGRQQRHPLADWDSVMSALDHFPWIQLSPISVNYKFRMKIWNEVKAKTCSSYDYRKWLKVCFPNHRTLLRLINMMKTSKNTIVLTGAGMSTESGIPDFRSENGVWKSVDPHRVATVEALNLNYPLFQKFYSSRLENLAKCRPHQGHYILAGWEKSGLIKGILTQNVDGFHQIAGNKNVEELHGSIRTFRCNSCNEKSSTQDFFEGKPCLRCEGKLRPDVVLFGEQLPEEAWINSFTKARDADLVIVIGSSLEVSPVNELPFLSHGKKVLINNNETIKDDGFDLLIRGKARDVLWDLYTLWEANEQIN